MKSKHRPMLKKLKDPGLVFAFTVVFQCYSDVKASCRRKINPHYSGKTTDHRVNLTKNDLGVVLDKPIGRNFQVQRRRTFARATTDVVV